MLKRGGATPPVRFGAYHSKNIRYHLNIVFQFMLVYYFCEVIKMNDDYLALEKFEEINLTDVFFNSLRENYEGFDDWFRQKAASGEMAYVSLSEENKINAFLYLKSEEGIVKDVDPVSSEIFKPRNIIVTGGCGFIGAATADDARMFLFGARLVARGVHQGDDRQVERVAQAHESRHFFG